jgi:SAM-dependent methyltransferase
MRLRGAEAARLGLPLTAVHAADEEFDFGRDRWDLIIIIYAIEKRSVYRVRRGLKPGGIVVIEAAHREPGGYPFGYESNELLKIFDGFRILRYEERLGVPDFPTDRSKRELLVRLMAQKPR